MAGNNLENSLLQAPSSPSLHSLRYQNNSSHPPASFSLLSYTAAKWRDAWTAVGSYSWNAAVAVNDTVEAATDGMRRFIKPYHESGIAYRIYGVADGINLIFSMFNLWYLFKHAWQCNLDILTPNEIKVALAEFHAAEKTLEGYISTVILFALWVIFSFVGSTFVEKQDHPNVKVFAFLLPHARTVLKQLKWTFKGLRSLFAVFLHYGIDQTCLIKLLFPMAAVIGLMAMVNSVVLRTIRDTRKNMVKTNIDINKQIVESKSLLHQLSEMPSSFEGFECSLVLLENDDSTLKTLYYISADGKPTELKIPENFDEKVAQQQTINLHARMKQHLNYVLTTQHAVSTQSENNLPIRLSFIANKSSIDILAYRNSYVCFSHAEDVKKHGHLAYIDGKGNVVQHESSAKFHETLLRTQENPDFLRLTAEQLTTIVGEQSVEVKLGHAYQRFTARRDTFLGLKQPPDEASQQEIIQIQTQPRNEAFFALFSATASALFDGLYFYIYALSNVIEMLSPTMALYMLGATAALFTVCVITRLAEEVEYQRRLDVSILRPKVELSKIDCTILHQQLELLMDIQSLKKSIVDTPESSDNTSLRATHKKLLELEQRLDIGVLNSAIDNELFSNKPIYDQAQLQTLREFFNSPQFQKSIDDRKTQLEGPDVPHIIEGCDDVLLTKLLWDKLRCSLESGKDLQDKLRTNLRGSYWAAAMTGLQNGLAVQGALSSFAFMVSTLLYGLQSPPVFAIACMAVGLTAVLLCCAQALVSYHYYRQKFDQDEREFLREFPAEELEKMRGSNDPLIEKNSDNLRKNIEHNKHFTLETRPDYVVMEWAEILRLLFSGWIKGDKAMVELYARLLDHPKDSYLPLIGSIVFAIALALRAIAKGFGAGRPDDDKAASKKRSPFIVGGLTLFDDAGRRSNVTEELASAPALLAVAV